MSDLVNHPAHYEEQSIRLEPIDFCERLPFCEGNAIKYCFRAGHKEGASELLAAIQIVDEQRNRDGSRGVKEISPTARAVFNQRTYRRPGYANIQETQTAD